MKFFRRRSATPNLSPAVVEAQMELQRLAQEQPALAEHAQALADVLPIVFRTDGPAPAWHLPADRLTAKWSGGVPVLRGESIPFATTLLANRWQQLCESMSRLIGKEAALSLANALHDRQWSLPEMIDEVLAGHADALLARAESRGLDPALAATLLRWTLLPALIPIQSILTATLPSGRWTHGYCPICGAWPLLGEFRGLEQARFLRCGLCAMSWEFPRLKCPFCGNDDHHRLGYLHEDGEEGKQRVAVCDACRGYVKMVATLTPLEPVRLLVMEVATLPLDLIAAERGYAAP